VVGGLPVAIFTGNGGGIPVIYIVACLILMLFSVGYLTMSRYVTDAGAFYTYISKGLVTTRARPHRYWRWSPTSQYRRQ
jgi:amino acid transporter